MRTLDAGRTVSGIHTAAINLVYTRRAAEFEDRHVLLVQGGSCYVRVV